MIVCVFGEGMGEGYGRRVWGGGGGGYLMFVIPAVQLRRDEWDAAPPPPSSLLASLPDYMPGLNSISRARF